MILCPHFLLSNFLSISIFFTALTLENNVLKFAVCSRYILFMVVIVAIFYNYLLSNNFWVKTKEISVTVWEIKRDSKCSVVLFFFLFRRKWWKRSHPNRDAIEARKKQTKQNIKSNPNRKDSFISSNLGFYLRNEKINNCTHTNRQLAKRKETPRYAIHT